VFEDLWLKIEETILILLRAFQELPPFKRIILAAGIILMIPSFFIAKYSSYAFWNFQYRDLAIVAKPSFTQSQDLIIGKTAVIRTGADTYAAYALVENKNLDLSFQKADYEFSFFTSNNTKVASARGSLYALPNQKKYVIASRVSSSESLASASLSVQTVQWQKKSVIPQIALHAPEPSLYNTLNPLELVAEGVVANNSPYRLATVRIVFLLFDKAGDIIGASERLEYSVKPNERRAYVQRWPSVYTDEVARIEVLPETNALDGNNLILQDLPGAGSSNLGRPEVNPF
jgi:hypothetical protein